MSETSSVSDLPPVLAAALARPLRRRLAPRGEGALGISRNNYLAEKPPEGGGGVDFPRNNYVAEPSGAPAEGGGGYDFSRNNYLAEQPGAGLPAEAQRAKAGAKPGNRNAHKHGRFGAKNLAAKREMRRYLRSVNAVCDEIGRMCNAGTALSEIDRYVAENLPVSPRAAFGEGSVRDEPRTPVSV